MAIETPTWIYKSKGDKQTASEMNQLAQSVIINATELSNIKDDVAELSNKTYNPEEYSGMGRATLRKNIINGVNVLTQEMISQANTIYEIRYDFDLNGSEITIPKDCVLGFQGGSFNNGVLNGVSTKIERNICIFGTDLDFTGTWLVPIISTSMFKDATGDSIIKALKLCNDDITNEVIVEKGDYTLNYMVEHASVSYFNYFIKIPSSNVILNIIGNIHIKANDKESYSIIQIKNIKNITIKGSGSLIGDKDNHIYTNYSPPGISTHEWGFGLQLYGCSNVEVTGINISNCTGDGIMINTAKDVRVNNIEIYNCRRQGISITDSTTNVDISNFYIHLLFFYFL